MRRALLIATCALGFSGCATTPLDPALTQLLDSIRQRLALADAVALHKWDQHQPVQATAREQAILDAVRLEAADNQLNPQVAVAFFSDQIEAGKLVQYALISDWQLQGQAPDLPRRDLQTDLRPRIDGLQQTLLQDLARFNHERPANCAQQLAIALNRDPADPLHQLALTRATGRLCE